MISYLSSIVSISLSYTISEILSLISENLKTSRDREHADTKEKFVIPMLNCYLANHCTKFDSSSFSHS